jgi:hypothetical protein
MDVFKQDAFSATSLSTAVDKIDYIPDQLSRIDGLFIPDPVRTTEIWIEERSTGAVVLPFSPRGAPPHQTGGDKRKARPFSTLRYGDASRITASELIGIRAFGSETELKTVQSEVARRQKKIIDNTKLTKEYHLFNCVAFAKVLDADGTVMYNWATEFSQSIPAEVDFDLDNATPASGAVRKKCTAARRSIKKALKGVGEPTGIVGICGDAFWDDLTGNPEVEKTFLNWSAAQDLRGNTGHGKEWSTFRYGEIDFVNYRGTDDSSFGVNTDLCKFFPVGAGIFRWAMSPGERMEHVGTLGQEFYSNMVLDKDRDAWADVEVYSYPLPVCTMPSALYQARRT